MTTASTIALVGHLGAKDQFAPKLAPRGDSFLFPSIAIIAALFFGSVLADTLDGAAWLLALIWLPLTLYVVFLAPLHIAVRVFVLLALVLEPADEMSGNGYWVPPLKPASTIFYYGMNRFTGISALSVSMFHVLAVILCVRALNAARPKGYVRPPKEAVRALRYLFVAVVTMALYGLARGGKVQPLFWQAIQPLCMAIMGLAFMHALRGVQDFRALAEVIVCAAITKGLLVAWVYEVVCAPLGFEPFYATTHSDSVTFGAALLIVASVAAEFRDKRSLLRFVILGLFFTVAVVMNHRRLAFVGIVGGLVTIFVYLPEDRFKKKVTLVLLAMSPFLSAYIVIGGHSQNPFFGPASLAVSVFTQTDRSSETRAIENYNLMTTMKQSPIVGPGLGFEYHEYVVADDISEGFSLYRYIAHNSVLWLLSVGGYLWFVVIWIIYAVHVFFASRAHRLALTKPERAGALAAASITIVCLAQDWGDMGFHSYMNLVIFGVIFAVGAKVCALREPA